MADVKWIKLTTDMFDNRKIKHLRRLPDGNSIVLIWVMLLTMAGRCNSNGMIFLTENIPYTPKMLADELDFEENTVQLALKSLEQFNMIVTDGRYLTIAGWEEYQNIEGMDRIREQNRIRKQRQRANQKLLEGERDSHVTVTQCHASDKEEEKDKEIESDKEELYKVGRSKKKVVKHAHGEFKNVLLTKNEYENLANSFGVQMRDKAITFLDEYIEEKGYKSKSHNMAIRRWVIDAVQERNDAKAKGKKEIVPKWCNVDADEAMNTAIERSYKTAAEDDSIRERMEALKQRIGQG